MTDQAIDKLDDVVRGLDNVELLSFVDCLYQNMRCNDIALDCIDAFEDWMRWESDELETAILAKYASDTKSALWLFFLEQVISETLLRKAWGYYYE